jgi:1-acyl-sn-glycerol-3-phosphate acyltransferase
MLRTIIMFIYFWLYLISIQPIYMRLKRLEKMGKIAEHDRLMAQTAWKWGRALVKCAGVTVVTTGQEKIPAEVPVLYVSNHQGNFDIPILLGYIDKPKAFIAKIELLKIPMLRAWMKQLKCVFLDRSDIRQSLKTINRAAEYLKQGYSMVIFPEGTRAKDNKMGEFKPGSLKLAIKAGVPIVPVAINGSYKIMEESGFIVKPAHVEVTVFDPIPTQGLTKEQADGLSDRVRGIIEQGLQAGHI